MSSFPSTARLREIRDRTDESCPFLFTLLGLVAVAEGVLRAADASDGGEADRRAGDDPDDDGLMVALGAVALAQRLLASCEATGRCERFTGVAAAPDSRSAAAALEEVWSETLI